MFGTGPVYEGCGDIGWGVLNEYMLDEWEFKGPAHRIVDWLVEFTRMRHPLLTGIRYHLTRSRVPSPIFSC